MPENTPLQRYVSFKFGGFYSWDVRQDLFWADETFAKIMGFSTHELDGGLPAARMIAIIHGDDVPYVADAIKNSVLSGEPFEMVYRIRRGDDFVKITEVGRCYRYEDGVATLFTGVVFENCPYFSDSLASNINVPVSP